MENGRFGCFSEQARRAREIDRIQQMGLPVDYRAEIVYDSNEVQHGVSRALSGALGAGGQACHWGRGCEEYLSQFPRSAASEF
jgi:hypothetical protein